MTNEDHELERWRSEWQALGGEEGFTRELIARVGRDRRRILRGVATEIIAVAFSSTVMIAVLMRHPGELPLLLVSALVLVFNGVWIARLFSVREGTFRNVGSAVEDWISLTRKRLDGDVSFNRFSTASTTVLTVALVPWGIWMYVAHRDFYRAEPWRAVVGFGAAAAILVGCFVYLAYKRKRLLSERERFEALVAQRVLR